MLSRRTRVIFILGVFVVVGAFGVWALDQAYPGIFPAWVDTLFVILAGLGVLLTVIASVFADLVLPVLDRTNQGPDSTIRELLRREEGTSEIRA